MKTYRGLALEVGYCVVLVVDSYENGYWPRSKSFSRLERIRLQFAGRNSVLLSVIGD